MVEQRKSIFITGAASGMGRATAQLFAAKGDGFNNFGRELEALQQGASQTSCRGTLQVELVGGLQYCQALSQKSGQRQKCSVFNSCWRIRYVC